MRNPNFSLRPSSRAGHAGATLVAVLLAMTLLVAGAAGARADDYQESASAARVWGNARAFLRECGLPLPSEDAFAHMLDHFSRGERERAMRAAAKAYNETWTKIRGTGADDSECSDAQDDIKSVEAYLTGAKRSR